MCEAEADVLKKSRRVGEGAQSCEGPGLRPLLKAYNPLFLDTAFTTTHWRDE